MFVWPLLQGVADSLPGCGTCGIYPSNGFWMSFLLPWFVNVPWSCLVPSFQGNMFLLWLISGGPVVGYASLAFVPHVSSGTMWGPYFCTSFHMDVLLRAAVTLVLGFFVCNRILDPF